MRHHTSIAFITALAALTACGGDSPSGPDTGGEDRAVHLAGSVYDLVTIDGSSLPVSDGTRSGCTAQDGTTYARTEVRIAAMELTFLDSILYTLSVSTQERCLGEDWTTPTTDWSTRTESRTGTYTSDGSSGTLLLGAATFPFTAVGRALTVYFLPDLAYAFQMR